MKCPIIISIWKYHHLTTHLSLSGEVESHSHLFVLSVIRSPSWRWTPSPGPGHPLCPSPPQHLAPRTEGWTCSGSLGSQTELSNVGSGQWSVGFPNIMMMIKRLHSMLKCYQTYWYWMYKSLDIDNKHCRYILHNCSDNVMGNLIRIISPFLEAVDWSCVVN